MALKALAWADADRSAAWPAPSVLYDCPLVENLNADLTSHQVLARGAQALLLVVGWICYRFMAD